MKGHHAPVGALEFRVEPLRLLLALRQGGKTLDKVAVLIADHGAGIARAQGAHRVGDDGQHIGQQGDRAGHRLVHGNGGTRRRGLDLQRVHQSARAGYPEAHAGGGHVATLENARKILDTLAAVAHPDNEARLRAPSQKEVDLAAAGVTQRISRDLGQSRRDAGLVLGAEANVLRHHPSALSRVNDVVVHLQRQGRDGPGRFGLRRAAGHVEPGARATITDASSRIRAWSRKSAPAIRVGWTPNKPGIASSDQDAEMPSECMTSRLSAGNG